MLYIFIIVFVSFDLKFKCNASLYFYTTRCNIFAKFAIYDLRCDYSRGNLAKDYLGYFGSYYKTYLETWALSTAE